MSSHTRLLSFLQRLMTRRKLVMSLIPVFMSSCCQQHLHKKKRENDIAISSASFVELFFNKQKT